MIDYGLLPFEEACEHYGTFLTGYKAKLLMDRFFMFLMCLVLLTSFILVLVALTTFITVSKTATMLNGALFFTVGVFFLLLETYQYFKKELKAYRLSVMLLHDLTYLEKRDINQYTPTDALTTVQLGKTGGVYSSDGSFKLEEGRYISNGAYLAITTEIGVYLYKRRSKRDI